MRGVKHRHLLRVFEAGQSASEGGAQEILYLTQQLGTSAELMGRLNAGGISEASTVLRYAESLGEAIEAAQVLGLHHGWMTPSDVVEVAGQVKLCGVGLFANMDTHAALSRWGADMRYLAPEVASGGDSSAASDWYSLAVILLELSTGEKVASVEGALGALAQLAPGQAEALRAATATDPKLRPTRVQDFMAPIRLAWQDPNAVTVEDQLPRVIDAQHGKAQSSDGADDTEPQLPPGADVPVRSFLDDDDDETVVHHGSPGEMMVSEVVSPDANTVTAESGPQIPLDNKATPISESPGLRLEALSMKPKARRQTNKTNYWLMVSLVLVAGATMVSAVLLVVGNSSDKEAGQGAETDAQIADTREPLPTGTAKAGKSELLVAGPACAGDMVHLADQGLCMDAYESPGSGRRPQSGLSLTEARAQCVERELRLCTAEEWEGACRAHGRGSWPYGERFQAEICNLRSGSIGLAGARTECRSSFAIYDMSGNIAEWVEEGQIRGGSALDRTKGRCSQLRSEPGRQSAYSDVGFRCCADAIASQASSD